MSVSPPCMHAHACTHAHAHTHTHRQTEYICPKRVTIGNLSTCLPQRYKGLERPATLSTSHILGTVSEGMVGGKREEMEEEEETEEKDESDCRCTDLSDN